MRSGTILLIAVSMWLSTRLAGASDLQWERLEVGAGETALVAVAVDAGEPEHVVAAGPHRLYESSDGGRHWEERFRTPGEATITTLAIQGGQRPVLLVGTDRGLHGSSDGGARWTTVFPGSDEREARCAFVAFHPSRPDVAALGTHGGLFVSDDAGRSWRPVRLPGDPQAIVSVAFAPQKICCANFLQHPAEHSGSAPAGWCHGCQPVGAMGFPQQRNNKIPCPSGRGILCAEDSLYALTPDRLLAGNLATAQWQERFNARATSPVRTSSNGASAFLPAPLDDVATAPEEEDLGEDLLDPALEETAGRLRAMVVDPQQPSTVYLGATHGLCWVSRDGGLTWQRLSRLGLAARTITRLVISSSPVPRWSPTLKAFGVAPPLTPRVGRTSRPPAGLDTTMPPTAEGRGAMAGLHAATTHGVARYDPMQHRWQLLTEGPAHTRIADVAATPRHLWIATDAGLFRASSVADPPPPPSALSRPDVAELFAHEPTIGDVRDAAIRYAETHPGKIASWRRLAQVRALLPSLSVSADTNLTDFRHWDAGANPDSLLRGERDMDWTTSLTWNLGDLIWNDDQTSIDVRSRLMVQLRNDIVDEVTRLYFERRRAQLARLLEPPGNPTALAEAELKIQELTALLDGLTGGEFSKRLTEAEQAQHRGGTRWK